MAVATFLLAACGPPTVDTRVLTPLPRAARAPAADAERAVITAERQRVAARHAADEAAAALQTAKAAIGRAEAGHGDVAFAHTDKAYKVQVLEQRRLQVELAHRRLALARARYELAKARVADQNSLPEAVDIDLEDFREEVEDAATRVAESDRAVEGYTMRLAILKKAVHTARVGSLKQGQARQDPVGH